MRYEKITREASPVKGAEVHLKQFDSFGELAERVALIGADWHQQEWIDSFFAPRRSDFIGRSDLPSCPARFAAAAGETWGHGVDVVGRMLESLAGDELPRPVSRRRRPSWSEDNGDEIDRDRLCSGQPFWRTTRRESVTGPATVTVVASVGAGSRVDADNILWRGAAAIALTDILESAGFRVELHALSLAEYVYSDGSAAATSVLLKESGEPLDAATLVNAVSGWAYRTAWFTERVRVEGIYAPQDNYLGSPIHEMTPETIGMITGVEGPFCFLTNFWSHADAVAAIREQLAQFC